MGERGQCNTDYTAQKVWENPYHEYDRAVFSVNYANRGDLFEGLSIWEEETFQRLQGTYPVISLSFANVKEQRYEIARRKICQIFSNLYSQNDFLLEGDLLNRNLKIC